MSNSRDRLADPSALQPLLPEEVKLGDVLDSGGQGIVYRGTAAGQDAAIKIYFPGQLKKRIDREIAALSEHRCRSIVRLLWSGVLELGGHPLPVVATEFIQGRPLAAVLDDGPLDAVALGRLAFDTTRAIAEMWSRRIVHRDLKPPNVMVRPTGRTCVIDLGVARHLNQSSLTAGVATWGTQGYMSPEQASFTRQLTCKSDLYALGVILVEAALGHHPTGRDQQTLLASGLHLNLPSGAAEWKHSELTGDLLNPDPIRRPRPSTVLKRLEEYRPTDTDA